jgi:hypothetical protein
MTGHEMDPYPDYESPEEGQDLDAIEAALSANPMVIHVAAAPE